MFLSLFRSLRWPGERVEPEHDAGAGITVFLHGLADYPVDVGRVARHQAQLGEIVDGRTAVGRRHDCIAALVPGAGEPGERNAVAVEIHGQIIGTCPGYFAGKYREWLLRSRIVNARVLCRAAIVGTCVPGPGASRAVRYAVKLDVTLPFKMTTR